MVVKRRRNECWDCPTAKLFNYRVDRHGQMNNARGNEPDDVIERERVTQRDHRPWLFPCPSSSSKISITIYIQVTITIKINITITIVFVNNYKTINNYQFLVYRIAEWLVSLIVTQMARVQVSLQTKTFFLVFII